MSLEKISLLNVLHQLQKINVSQIVNYIVYHKRIALGRYRIY